MCQMAYQRRKNSFVSWLLIVGVVLCMALMPARAEKEPAYAFRADVNEVRLTFVATDRDNAEPKIITPADIAVVDDGTVVRHFRSLSRLSQVNLSLVLLIDASESVRQQFHRQIADAERLIADARWRPADQISVLFFGGREAAFACIRNCRSLSPETWSAKIHAQGLTPMYDALVLAAEFAAENSDPNYRSVSILMSDGHDTISRHSALDAVSAALRAELPIYTLDTRNPKVTTEEGMLAKLASATGGRSFAGSDVSTALASLLDDARRAYVLTYEPPSHTEGAHSVRILPTSNLNLRFRCRRAYYYARTDLDTQKENQ